MSDSHIYFRTYEGARAAHRAMAEATGVVTVGYAHGNERVEFGGGLRIYFRVSVQAHTREAAVPLPVPPTNHSAETRHLTAQTIYQLVQSGYEQESIVDYIATGDIAKLREA